MDIKQIEGFTHKMAPPSDWDEAKNGVCETLAVKATVGHDGLVWLVSEWQPSPEEVEQLRQGATIKLAVQGKGHPVVAMAVGEMVL